ncbi:MAG: Crp/Fnr family transcriptional regulator [Anaerorhabdus sp.]
MKKSELIKNALFNSFSEKEFQECINKLKTVQLSANKIIANQGDEVQCFFIILSGKVEVYSYDLRGNKKMVTIFQEGDLFAESVVLGTERMSPFFIETKSGAEVLRISPDEIFNQSYSVKLIGNLIRIIATKNQFLTHKIECLDKNTIEERIYEVLNYYRLKQHSFLVTLPYNKTQLAEYLSVNRSALSRELSNMEKKGIFKSKKNQYSLNPEYFK